MRQDDFDQGCWKLLRARGALVNKRAYSLIKGTNENERAS
jgi:hypothetical protein